MKKNFLRNIVVWLVMVCCWSAILICVSSYAFLTTTWGARLAATLLIKSYIPFGDVTVGSYQGTIEKGLLLRNVIINHIPTMYVGSIQVQDLYVKIPLVSWNKISVKVSGARLMLPSSDAIIFNGTMVEDQLKGNCFANSVDAKQVVAALGYPELARDIYGFITHIDLSIEGSVKNPRFKGHFFVDKFIYKGMTQVGDGFGHLDLKILSLGKIPTMEGSLILESALVKTHQVDIDLTTSKVNFKGDVTNMLLDIYGSSKVEDINIDMAIKGTLQKPILTFNSDPPMPEEQILMILVTDKGWSGMEEELSHGVGLRKKLSETFNVGMGVEERRALPGQALPVGYARTIEGQMNLTDKVSVNFSQKYLRSDNGSAPIGTEPSSKENNSELYLQYKKRF